MVPNLVLEFRFRMVSSSNPHTCIYLPPFVFVLVFYKASHAFFGGKRYIAWLKLPFSQIGHAIWWRVTLFCSILRYSKLNARYWAQLVNYSRYLGPPTKEEKRHKRRYFEDWNKATTDKLKQNLLHYLERNEKWDAPLIWSYLRSEKRDVKTLGTIPLCSLLFACPSPWSLARCWYSNPLLKSGTQTLVLLGPSPPSTCNLFSPPSCPSVLFLCHLWFEVVS